MAERRAQSPEPHARGLVSVNSELATGIATHLENVSTDYERDLAEKVAQGARKDFKWLVNEVENYTEWPVGDALFTGLQETDGTVYLLPPESNDAK